MRLNKVQSTAIYLWFNDFIVNAPQTKWPPESYNPGGHHKPLSTIINPYKPLFDNLLFEYPYPK